MTGSGTCMEAMERRWLPLQKVSPDEQSMPNMATMSPEEEASISSISEECIRTRRPTLWRFPVRALMMVSPLLSVPW